MQNNEGRQGAKSEIRETSLGDKAAAAAKSEIIKGEAAAAANFRNQ